METPIRISELYLGLQGEGVYTGIPTVLARFQGCNLLSCGLCCEWCDSKFAQEPQGGTVMTVKSIADEVNKLLTYYQSWISITGGEPLFQEQGLKELVVQLRKMGYRISVETNGTISKPDWWTMVDSWVADIKCPSSGVTSLVDEWFKARECDQIKFVVGNEDDLRYAHDVLVRNAVRAPVRLVSPVIDGGIDLQGQRPWFERVWQFCVEERVRFSLQAHKVVFGNRRGV